MASSSSNTRTARVERSPESFESFQRRNMAAETLQSYEKLSWLSYSRRESLQQTRMHLQNIVAGFTAADEAALVTWSTDNSPLPDRHANDDKNSRKKSAGSTAKGKDRTSNGTAAGAASTLPGSPSTKGKERAKDSSRTSDMSAKKKRRS